MLLIRYQGHGCVSKDVSRPNVFRPKGGRPKTDGYRVNAKRSTKSIIGRKSLLLRLGIAVTLAPKLLDHNDIRQNDTWSTSKIKCHIYPLPPNFLWVQVLHLTKAKCCTTSYARNFMNVYIKLECLYLARLTSLVCSFRVRLEPTWFEHSWVTPWP
jgi:hypothetical protein